MIDNDKSLSSPPSTETTNVNNQNSTLTSRFSLILLEPGEIYFEDYLVYYYELKSPFEQTSYQLNNKRVQKGNLKICSKSIVFDPLNFSYPLIKFPLKSIENIKQFNEDDTDDIYSSSMSSDSINLNLKQKCFAISTKQTISCKPNNKIGPFTIHKREQSNDLHYFQFIFTNCNDSLDLFLQLHRASTLDYEQEDLMLQLIVKSRLNRDKFKFDLHQLEDVLKEQIQLEAVVNKINPLVANPGKIILTNMCIYYKPFNNLQEDSNNFILKIKLKKIKYVIKRRYHLKRVGLEIQFIDKDEITFDQTSINRLPYLYLTFEDESTRDLFYTRLIVEQRDKLINLDEFSQENMLQKWRYGSISNYEYLMYLNNISDRSYNDLTQYPVFPWVLNDYSSDNLDLNDPNSFRDLSKPIGALNQERLKRLKERSNEILNASTGTPSFLYGSHYSTPAFVLFYLVRDQPEWQLCLQNGKFDHPNRLFHSITDTWKNCLNIDSDVKELIPEFYDLDNPGLFLRNHLELDLGVRQDGVRVNHVTLPKWANNNPKEFIKKMRDALESSYVSENLHLWIDLIWGYKQRGDEAVKSDNLFYYLCYEGAVDLDSIKDYSERKSLEIQIQEFGQIPTQLFKQAHLPKAKQLIEINNLIENLDTNINKLDDDQENDKEKNLKKKSNNNSSNIHENKSLNNTNRITPQIFKNLETKLSTKIHKSQLNDLIFIDNNHQKLPLLCSISNDNWLKIYSLEDRSIFRSYNVSNFSLSSVDLLQTTKQNDNLLFLSSWDNSIYIYDLNYNRCIYSLNDAHDDAISCIRLLKTTNSTNIIVLTSSWDSLIKIWKLNINSNQNLKLQYLNELSHDSSVIKFELNENYLASICDDGNLNIWKMNKKINSSSMPNMDLDMDELDNDEYITNVYIEQDLDIENSFNYLFNIQCSTNDGKITDCKLLESNDSIETLSFCTSCGLVKIFNIKTNSELFSLKIYTPNTHQTPAKLNKLIYSLDYIITIDSNGYVYFIDLQQQVNTSDSATSASLLLNDQCLTTTNRNRSNSINTSSFLTHVLKLTTNSLQSIKIYDNLIISIGDSDGNLYFLTLLDDI